MFRMNINRYNASSSEYRVRGTATVYFFRILSGSGKHAFFFQLWSLFRELVHGVVGA